MKTPEVMKILADRYHAPSHAFIPEFRGGTGYKVEQRVDALAMDLWPSSKNGLKLIGFEVKVSRSDWRHEMENPRKCDFMKKFCDYWYLVVGDLNVVKYPHEIPPDWGLMFIEDGKLHTMIEAPLLTPEPIDRLFLASLMRRVNKVESLSPSSSTNELDTVQQKT